MILRIILGVVGVVAGIFAGMVFMMLLHMASTLIYPLPAGVSFMSQEPENQAALQAWFETLPTGAWLLAVLCHGLGCMFGAAVAVLISGRRSIVPAVIVGVFFTIGGVMNLSSVPHPGWFPLIDLPVYLLLALAAGFGLKKKQADAASANS